MTGMVQRLPPSYLARTKSDAMKVLENPEASPSLKQLAWRFLLHERRRGEPVAPPCGTEGGAA